MRKNWVLVQHKCMISSTRILSLGGLYFVQLALLPLPLLFLLLLTHLPGSVRSYDLSFGYDNDSLSRSNNNSHHHLHRRRHSDVGTMQSDDDDERGKRTNITRNGIIRGELSVRGVVGVVVGVSGVCPVPGRCSRPDEKLQCKGGVSIIRDGCNCCFICARQQGDICDHRQRCDEDKDQFCDYTLDDGLRGICRAQSGRACEVEGGRVYSDGDRFQLNCSQLCTCQNGQYACASLCPQEDRRPSKGYCDDVQLIPITGRCCREWVCPHSAHNLPQSKDEEQDTTKLIPGDGGRDRWCVKETTGWSECSVSCGFGWSVRLTNENDDCLSVQERRLCIIRPCHLNDKHMEGRQCKTTWKETDSIRIRYNACISTKDFRPKYCSTCKRKRCCRPDLTKTLLVQMLCTTASHTNISSSSISSLSNLSNRTTTIVEKLMWIKSCRCMESYCKT